MPSDKRSEDERIEMLEQIMPQILRSLAVVERRLDEQGAQLKTLRRPAQRALDAVPTTGMLFEQSLALSRSLYLQAAWPEASSSAEQCDVDVCFDFTLTSPAIRVGQRARIEDSPLGCVELLGYAISDGSATFKICCTRRDDTAECVTEVALIVHPAGSPDTPVYQEKRTVVCRGRRTFLV